MHIADFKTILITDIKTVTLAKLAVDVFIPANGLYDRAVKTPRERYEFWINNASRIVSFDSVKTSIYGWMSDLMPYTLVFLILPILTTQVLIYQMVGASS